MPSFVDRINILDTYYRRSQNLSIMLSNCHCNPKYDDAYR